MGNDELSQDDRIGRYVLEKELGRGGQGRVYLARDEKIGLKVALKVLDPGHALSRNAQLRFRGEAEKAARIDHPNIAKVLEWSDDESIPFIAMEFVKGQTLANHILESKRKEEDYSPVTELHLSFGEDTTDVVSPVLGSVDSTPTPATPPSSSAGSVDRKAIFEVAALIESAARGLHEAHERGLIHRDIKPGNLIVAENRGLVVVDFGLAHDEESDGPNLTMTGDILGTPAYMSPEQLVAKRVRVDRRSDVYSLGVTLFECLALRKPFEAPSREALFQEIIAREAPDLRKINRRVPVDLAVIVHHALEKHPDQRYPSALELAEDLRRFREHEPIVARPVGPFARTWRWAQRKPAAAGLLATVIVALASIAAITSINNRRLGRLNIDLAQTTQTAKAKAEEARTNERRAAAEAAAKSIALREKSKALEREQEAREAESAALSEKSAALFEYERMADTRRLANARVAAEEMWPVHPDLVPPLMAWQKKYAPLFARLESHRVALDALRAKAPAYTEENRKRDFAAEFARIATIEEELTKLRKRLETDRSEEKTRTGTEPITRLEIKLAELRKIVRSRRNWDYGEDVDLQFRHDTLAKLVTDLTAFIANKNGVVASVTRRLDRSRRIRRETIDDHSVLWVQAIARITSNPRYGSLTLKPQVGLIPLGIDPASGLEEFLDWRTHDWLESNGSLPARGENGRMVMTETRGMIFVLIPGGAFWMGAQRDPQKRNSDPESRSIESPVREITLTPYFISKYEMTQGQWSRLDGLNPSQYAVGFFSAGVMKRPIDMRHPVERVSWEDSQQRLGQMGLRLPTEAQWERAARGGVNPPMLWAGTSDLTELAHYANIAGRETNPTFPGRSPEHTDSFVIHAPVGSFAANPFGLFDITGNVLEWCRDSFSDYAGKPAPGNGLRRSSSRDRVYRGGSYNYPATIARVTNRYANVSTMRQSHVGVRPSRSVTTE